MNRFERRVRTRVGEVTGWLEALRFEAVQGPNVDIAVDDTAALWCVTARRDGLPDVLFDIGERIEPGANGLPAQYRYQCASVTARAAWPGNTGWTFTGIRRVIQSRLRTGTTMR